MDPVERSGPAAMAVDEWLLDTAVKPVLRVASGDTIRVETMIARGLQRLRAASRTRLEAALLASA